MNRELSKIVHPQYEYRLSRVKHSYLPMNDRTVVYPSQVVYEGLAVPRNGKRRKSPLSRRLLFTTDQRLDGL